jgi:hypothetical protein
MKKNKYAILNEAATAAAHRIGRPASLHEIAMNMREHGFEFTARCCINDLYTHPSRLKGLMRVAVDLHKPRPIPC